MLEGSFVVFAAFSNCCSTGISLLVAHSVNVIVNLIFADDGDQLVMANVAKVYLKMSHTFVPILTDMFNLWFAQGAIPGNINKGVITLLKKGGRHVWEDLDNYRPITQLNIVKDFGPGLSKPFTACHQWSDRTLAELCCEGKIDLRQLESCLWGPRGVKRWY